ncbi:hypothetical protein [Paenibacillus jiagnxiensis]|uniref:hypothetical protein n=1 Tax=Paenibacillus jiagnxiensis TaxID=3228926 RepID=UPI0033A960CE
MLKTLKDQLQVEIDDLEKEIAMEMDTLIEISEERPDLPLAHLIARQQSEFVRLFLDHHLKKKMLRLLEENKPSEKFDQELAVPLVEQSS